MNDLAAFILGPEKPAKVLSSEDADAPRQSTLGPSQHDEEFAGRGSPAHGKEFDEFATAQSNRAKVKPRSGSRFDTPQSVPSSEFNEAFARQVAPKDEPPADIRLERVTR